jgi:hypothetical protein
MTLTITQEMIRLQEIAEHRGYGAGNSATERMLREIEKIQRLHEQMDAISAAERITREVEKIKQQASGVWGAIKETHRRAYEQIDRFRQQMAVVERLQRQLQTVRHRSQDGATGKGKTSSAKKSAKSSSSGTSSGGSSGTGGGGGGGGDGDGDGDGPQRTPSKPKKPRSKARSTSLQRLPRSSSGETATTSSPQVLPNHPQPNHGIAIIAMAALFGIVLTDPNPFILGLIVVCLLVIVLVAMGHLDLAKHVWNSAPKLFKPLAKDADEESEDPDEES